jgi:fructose-bisphosphate aldolase, class II
MYALREILARAQATGVAVGHFNVADLVLLKAVFASGSGEAAQGGRTL